MTAVEGAWEDVLYLLPAGWRVDPPTVRPDGMGWDVTATAETPGPRDAPSRVAGNSRDEVAALVDLRRGLGEVNRRLLDLAREELEQQLGRTPGIEEMMRSVFE